MTTLPLNLSPSDFPYFSRRMPVLAPRGVVATSEALAAQAGLSMLQRGGSAVDAAIATAIALTVVEPTSNGIGSDAFALVWDGSKLHGLNGSGRAPGAHSPELFRARGLTEIPRTGWLAVTVPGAPAAWRDLHARFGKLSFEELFEPAIFYAERGYPVGPVTGNAWAAAERLYRANHTGPEFRGWFETFTSNGGAPRPGDLFALDGHARSLQLIARSKASAFYEGELAQQISGFAAETGGHITREDLASHESTWVEPISTNYRGYDVWEIPPNGQGIAALIALNLLEGFTIAEHPRDSVESFHLQIECIKLAFADTHHFVADPAFAQVPVEGLLNKEYAAGRRALVNERAATPSPGSPPKGGTVYLCAADADGMMVSYIQSNFAGFGSGIVVPGTGIALQNRGFGFTLDEGHPNVIAPGKRPFHTIIPAFLTRDGKGVGPFGVMGGHMQPQGHFQLAVNQIDYGLNPQAAVDAPRWEWIQGQTVEVETTVDPAIVAGLTARGHEVKVVPTLTGGPKGQIIRRLANGSYIAGSEPRSDGLAAGW